MFILLPGRRSAQLLKYLYCTYAIPAWLMDWLLCEGTVELASAAHERSLALLMSIVYEMGNGRSPRPILRPYLSKAEMAIFFRTGRPADLQTTAFSHFVYCKALARGLPRPVCARLAHVASEARLDKLKIFQFVQNFVEFCAVREVNQISVQDIWDYLRCNQLIGVFSFKGRTLSSMLNLVNTWHEMLNREARILAPNRFAKDWRAMQDRVCDLKIVYKNASGIPETWSTWDAQSCMPVEVRQLTRYTELINEGRAMHNCVAGYHQRCAQNSCSIFSLRIGANARPQLRSARIRLCRQGAIAIEA